MLGDLRFDPIVEAQRVPWQVIRVALVHVVGHAESLDDDQFFALLRGRNRAERFYALDRRDRIAVAEDGEVGPDDRIGGIGGWTLVDEQLRLLKRGNRGKGRDGVGGLGNGGESSGGKQADGYAEG